MSSKPFRAAMYTALFAASSCASVQAATLTEHEVEAAFVYHIVKFVEWPAEFRAGGKLRLCIMGQAPFAKAAALLAGKQVGGRAWEVRHVDFYANLQECRVLFIAASESDNLRRVLADIKDSAILTVGDSEGYAERGVMVNFYSEQNKVRLEINTDAVRRGGLKVSSQLLKLARIVNQPRGMQ
ncbi:MAG: YfiR family protein [Gallionella sp.]|nr:YfiR family protein [Gallionella sp.]